jgi:hypothetical protein
MTIRRLLEQYFALGAIVGPFPFTISNGQTIDANPVMADLDWLQSQVNANALPLSGGSVTPGTGGTGSTTGGGLTYFTPSGGVGGTANAITLVTTVVPPSLAYGQFFAFVATATNTGPVTLSVNTQAGSSAALGVEQEIAGEFLPLRGGEIELGGFYRMWVNFGATLWAMERVNNGTTWKLPPNPQSANYSLALQDSGGSIIHPASDTSARTWTIPNYSTVTWDQGTAITLVGEPSSGVITLAITAPDNLILCPAGTTGNRTLTAPFMATMFASSVGTGGAMKWLIQGTNIT